MNATQDHQSPLWAKLTIARVRSEAEPLDECNTGSSEPFMGETDHSEGA
jgi:hypothetical protein